MTDFDEHIGVELENENVIGQGTFGNVITGSFNGISVAVKLMKSNMLDVFKRERDFVSYVSPHSNICRVLAAGKTTQGLNALVFERFACDVFSIVTKHGVLSEDKVQWILCPIIDALAHCHKKQVAHCDVKLENICLDFQYRPVLIDFGSANTIKFGSSSYAAPEIWIEAAVEPCTGLSLNPMFCARDVWSLGICAFAMAVGYFPFKSAQWTDSCFRQVFKGGGLHSILTTIYRCYSDNGDHKITCFFEDAIERMLVVNPQHRDSAETLLKCKWVSEALDRQSHTCRGSKQPGFRPM